jgi:hypothetical protein
VRHNNYMVVRVRCGGMRVVWLYVFGAAQQLHVCTRLVKEGQR